MANKSFAEAVQALVATIPEGRVMTYGQVAALCGSPRAARVVGQIAHFGPEALPWHRVVNREGGLASGYSFGGREAHARALELEGVEVEEWRVVHFEDRLWWPHE